MEGTASPARHRQKALMRSLLNLVLVLSLLTGAFGFDKPSSAPLDRLGELRAKAERANERDQCNALADLVRELVNEIEREVQAGYLDKAHVTASEVISNVDKCKEAAKNSKHKLKDAEITLRKAARRLDDINHTLPVDDRPAMQAALDRIEAARTELLRQMFKR
jgi:hypothetical protein